MKRILCSDISCIHCVPATIKFAQFLVCNIDKDITTNCSTYKCDKYESREGKLEQIEN